MRPTMPCMVYMLWLLLLHVCKARTTSSPLSTKYFNKHGCHNDGIGQFSMTCDPGYMIRIKRTIYGYSPSGECYFQSTDCTLEEQIHYPCVGERHCEINVPQGSGRMIHQCQKTSNYFQVDYECIPNIMTKNICDHGELTELSGFLKSPNFPFSYYGALQCTTNIKVPDGYKIRLHIIDLDLAEVNAMQCRDSLSVRQLSTVTLCGKRANEDITLTPFNEMMIEFHAAKGPGNKGFWLYYEAYTTVKLTTRKTDLTVKNTHPKSRKNKDSNSPKLPKTELQTKDIENSRPITEDINNTDNKHLKTDGTQEDIPYAPIIGGVIGSLLVVLIILVSILLLKWWKEQCIFQNRTHKKFNEIPNNAFQSNSDLFPPVQLEV